MKKVEKLLVNSVAVLSYASPLCIGVWRVLRRNSDAPRDQPAQGTKHPETKAQSGADGEGFQPPPPKEEPLESLSLSVPGQAPLDRLARRGAWELHEEHCPDGERFRNSEPPGSAEPHAADSESVQSLLEYQDLESYRLEEWNLPRPDRLPVPTAAPSIMALGIIFFAMGLATVWYVCVVGALMFAVAAWRWTGELQGE